MRIACFAESYHMASWQTRLAGPTGHCSTLSVILVEKLFLIISSQFTVLKNALPLASCNRLIGILEMWKAKF